MNLGINLSFAIKRWVEPPVWARFVRESLGLELVQFTYDLIDPWWPEASRRPMAAEVRKAAKTGASQSKAHSAGSPIIALTACSIRMPRAETRRWSGGSALSMSPPKLEQRLPGGPSAA